MANYEFSELIEWDQKIRAKADAFGPFFLGLSKKI